ncbi:MAG: AraC family transcriptional regulator, partial [Eubacterium sp.]|nr:AraC family transcriptional regulator [Eubacterium sp.]
MKDTSKEIIRYHSTQGISVTDSNAPEHFPTHWHDAAEFTLILKDNCRYKIGDNEYNLMTGDILLVWPRELHEVIDTPPDSTLFIQFAPIVLESNLDVISVSNNMYQHHHIKASEEPRLAGAIAARIREIRSIYNGNQTFKETRCKMKLYEIILALGEYTLQEQKEQIISANVSTTAWKYIETACEYINEHYSDNLTQSEVASHIGLSPYYFSRLFKECMKTTFPAYLSSIRIKEAIRLLTDDSITITDCAFQSGFQSTTAFNKIFHDITGCSPR